jgi:hypothetical protein
MRVKPTNPITMTALVGLVIVLFGFGENSRSAAEGWLILIGLVIIVVAGLMALARRLRR